MSLEFLRDNGRESDDTTTPIDFSRDPPFPRIKVAFLPVYRSHARTGSSAALMLKDLKLAQEAAASAGSNTPLGAAAAQLYVLFNTAGGAREDFSGIINFLRGRA
jgi:NAD-binding of NADP-dependent 3-hydroxyisobutyrate dehydrogenase